MRKPNKIYKNLLFLFAVFCLQSQTYSQNGVYANSDYVESVFLVTGRDMYCVGEKVLFKAYNTSPESLRKIEWSKVLYVELISSSGQAISQHKFRFNSRGSMGSIDIPKTTKSGVYFLKAYTKWMRNFSTSNYSYSPIKIINPFTSEIVEQKQKPGEKINFKEIELLRNKDITISISRQLCQTREKLVVNLESKEKPYDNVLVYVVKKELFQEKYFNMDKKSDNKFISEFLPETRGITLSGIVGSENNSESLTFNPIYATLFDYNTSVFGAITDSSGRFNLGLKDSEGEFEIFINTKASKGEEKAVIRIDNDFCTKPVDLPFIPFELSDSEKKIANEICFNQQLVNTYVANKQAADSISYSKTAPFYGEPNYVVFFDEFVKLPTTGDYIHELLPNVSVRQRNKTNILNVAGVYPEMSIYPPLVLIDMVPIFDIDRILIASPEGIERVEVIDLPYILGNQIFGGVVSFFSKENDLAGIDLPTWGSFIKYKLYSNFDHPEFQPPTDSRMPDARNLLYWSNLDLKADMAGELEIYTADTKGEYVVVVRGMHVNGKPYFNYCSFLVE